MKLSVCWISKVFEEEVAVSITFIRPWEIRLLSKCPTFPTKEILTDVKENFTLSFERFIALIKQCGFFSCFWHSQLQVILPHPADWEQAITFLFRRHLFIREISLRLKSTLWENPPLISLFRLTLRAWTQQSGTVTLALTRCDSCQIKYSKVKFNWMYLEKREKSCLSNPWDKTCGQCSL